MKWLMTLWTSTFVKTIVLDKYRVYVDFNFGGFMLFTILLLVLIGIGLGVLGTTLVIKWINTVKR